MTKPELEKEITKLEEKVMRLEQEKLRLENDKEKQSKKIEELQEKNKQRESQIEQLLGIANNAQSLAKRETRIVNALIDGADAIRGKQ